MTRVHGSLHHVPASGGMHVEDRDAKPDGFDCGRRDGVRNIMKFQIEEDISPACNDTANDFRSCRREELGTNFKGTRYITELVHESEGPGGGVNIKGYDKFVLIVH